MKKTFLLTVLLTVFFTVSGKAQSATDSDVRKYNVTQETKVPFRLFPTSNRFNFLKLDTRTGQIWMVQYGVGNDSSAGTWVVDDTAIEEATNANVGRFTLYTTANMWNLILLDQIDGRTWQVQYYPSDRNKNFRTRIY